MNQVEQAEKLPGDESKTPVRPPSEDIIEGAGNDDQLKKMQQNAKENPVKEDAEVGTSPAAYPGPKKGD